MRQNVRKSMLLLRMLTLALLLMGMLIITPSSISAGDPGNPPVQAPNRIGGEGIGLSGSGGTVNSFSSGNIVFEQPPISTDQNWQAWTSASNTISGDILCMDDFWGLSDNINDIHWYGLTMIWDNNTENPDYFVGDPSGMQFEIIFYEDNSGTSGAKVAEFSNISPTFENYVIYYSQNINYQAYRFDVAGLNVPTGLTKGWVSIRSTYSPSSSQFLWLISSTGNDNAMQIVPNNPNEPTGNFSFALTKAPPPVPSVSLWGSIILVIFFSIMLVCTIRRRQIRSKLH